MTSSTRLRHSFYLLYYYKTLLVQKYRQVPSSTFLTSSTHSGTQFTCFTSRNVQILSLSTDQQVLDVVYPTYLLSWYESTNLTQKARRHVVRASNSPRSCTSCMTSCVASRCQYLYSCTIKASSFVLVKQLLACCTCCFMYDVMCRIETLSLLALLAQKYKY